MNPNKILNSPIINKAALSRIMYPQSRSPKTMLAHKINGNNGQRITEQDEQKVIEIITELIKD